MSVADRFDITGKGIVVTGEVLSGRVNSGETLCLTNIKGDMLLVKVKGIERINEQLTYACAGDTIGMILEDVTKSQISKGDFLYKITLK